MNMHEHSEQQQVSAARHGPHRGEHLTGAQHHLVALQRSAGNQATTALLREADTDGSAEPAVLVEEPIPNVEGAMPDTAPRGLRFVDAGMVGVTPFGGPIGAGCRHLPHAFINGGMTGTVVWNGGGGAGAHGNEGAGTLQAQTPPTYTSSAGPAAGKFSSAITAGTGTVSVTRSFLGAFSGAQGNGWFLTAAATGRINAHENTHVASTRGIYNANLKPMEDRIANAALGQNIADNGPGAVTAHKAVIKWQESIDAFSAADRTANQPGGTTDTTDTGGAGTWIVDNGPGTVGGTAFTHICTKAGEALPAP